MTRKELLRDKLAPAVGRVILKHAFGADAAAIGGTVLDWLSTKFKSSDQARQAERFARDVSQAIVEGLVPIFEQDHSADLNPEAVALALGHTLDQHIDSKFLVIHDLDPARLIPATFKLRPRADLKKEAYSTADIELYERSLPELIRQLVPRAKAFENFEGANAAEVLQRLRALSDQNRRLGEGMEYLVRARKVWERRRAENWRKFENEYADAILDRWNKLELFGIDLSTEVQRKQKLSVAYIPLNLQDAETADQRRFPGHLVSFEELLNRSVETRRALVILGEAGSGKTTLLRWLACQAIARLTEDDAVSPFVSIGHERVKLALTGAPRREDVAIDFREQPALVWWARVPFLVRLREVKDGALPKEDAWPGKSAALPRDPPTGWLEEILGAGHGLILLDGLDELGSEGREVARDTLRNIMRDRRGNLVILTSRPGAFEAEWFEHVPLELATIRPMSPAQRETCICNWHEAVAQAKPDEDEKIRNLCKDLISEIRVSPYLQEPTTNPLVCAATCALHYGRQGYLPRRVAKLFDALSDMLIHDRDERQRLIPQANVPVAYRGLELGHKRQLLEEIAAEMVLCRQSERSRADTLVCVRERLAGIPGHRAADPEDILKGLLLRSSLLRPSGAADVDFLHNAFKEYLAAARFLSRRSHPYLVEEADYDPGDRVFAYGYAIASARGEEDLTEKLIHGLLDRKSSDEATARKAPAPRAPLPGPDCERSQVGLGSL